MYNILYILNYILNILFNHFRFHCMLFANVIIRELSVKDEVNR